MVCLSVKCGNLGLMSEKRVRSTTRFPRGAEASRRWFLVNAEGQPLGRLASRVARILMGKHKPLFWPSCDTGDHVVVLNAAKVLLSGKKEHDKVFYRHSGYPGGLKSARVEEVRAKDATLLVEGAVRGMLPKTRLGRSQLRKLKVYSGPDHPHQAQKPAPLDLRRPLAG
jgi:large subunit ribosomal protein L13